MCGRTAGFPCILRSEAALSLRSEHKGIPPVYTAHFLSERKAAHRAYIGERKSDHECGNVGIEVS